MSRMLAAGAAISTALISTGQAQDTYGPVEDGGEHEDAPLPLVEEQPCETETQEDGVILVCRELTDSERYMSPLPKPVPSDRTIIPGLTDPPCWVTGAPNCIRFGWVPEPAIMVDVTAFPEPLSNEEAARVTAIESEGDQGGHGTPLGERVPIDLDDDD